MFSCKTKGLLKLDPARKLISAQDAAKKVFSNDCIVVSGFVAQGCPDELIRHLALRFEEKGSPEKLTLLFGGGPGDFKTLGLNRLAEKPGLLKMTVGGHYGQVPLIANRVIANEFPGFALPMGSISKMIRSAASHTPFHVSTVGLGTFVDPRQKGGRLNALAEQVEPMVQLVTFNGTEYLQYRTLPINIAFLQASTADLNGNLTMERESLLGDIRIQANAAKASGGLVIAQVSRLAKENSLSARNIHVPGSLVDFIVHVPEQPQSFFMGYSPARAGEIRVPVFASSPPSASSTTTTDEKQEEKDPVRDIIARRAAMELHLHDIVNLGIGMPEGVAKVALKENVLEHITLTTEAGVVGGQAMSGHEFGPGENYDALVEMNAQFDFYNGGGLNCAFLGMGQVAANGDVNVSRLTNSKLTGPGGFMDIATGTQKVVFMGSFLKKNGKVRTFQQTCGLERTFDGPRALHAGQRILYVSERAVFSLNYRGVLKLEEVSPVVDLQRDVLDHMDFRPHGIETVKLMDPRIFDLENSCGLEEAFFYIPQLISQRIRCYPDRKLFFVDFSKQYIPDLAAAKELSEETVRQCFEKAAKHAMTGTDGITVVLKLDRTKVPVGIQKLAQELFEKEFSSVCKNPRVVFWRAGKVLNTKAPPSVENIEILWEDWVKLGSKYLSRTALREQLERNLGKRIMPIELDVYMGGKGAISFDEFPQLLARIRKRLFDL